MKKVYVTPKDNLQKVFDALEPHTTVYLENGRYYGKFLLKAPFVTLVGSGDTVITYDDYAKREANGVEIGTFQSFTLAVISDDVTFRNLTVENTAKSPEKLGQEVALSVYGNRFTAKNCKFSSTQDTLFLGPLPDDLVVRYDGFLPDYLRYYEGQTYQKFISCEISGTVDFIFGCGNALFQACDIISVNDGRDIGYVAAPAHHLACDIGFVFNECRLISRDAPTVYLARPWRDFGKAVYINCSYQNHISDKGFINWNDTYREKTARFYEYTKDNLSRPCWTHTMTEKEASEFLNAAKKHFEF